MTCCTGVFMLKWHWSGEACKTSEERTYRIQNGDAHFVCVFPVWRQIYKGQVSVYRNTLCLISYGLRGWALFFDMGYLSVIVLFDLLTYKSEHLLFL